MTTTPPRKKPAMTTTLHNNFLRASEVRSERATHRLATLANYVFGEGFQPDIAAIAAGYKTRASAYSAAHHAGRPELAAALRLPTPAEKRAAQIEDIEFLLDRGEHPERAAHRCGFTSAEGAEKLLRKWGRSDLASRLTIPPLDTDEWDAA